MLKSRDIHKDFAGHLQDLRIFLIFAVISYIIIFAICFYFADNIYNFLANSLLLALKQHQLSSSLIITEVNELFFTYIKITFFTALIIFIPLFLFLLFIFLLPSLKTVEKKIVILLLFLIPTLFVLGALTAYYISLDVIWQFFINFNSAKTVQMLPKVNRYISLVLNIIFAFGISFELPVLMLILFLLKIVSIKKIIAYSRYAFVLAFILAAILTPPDPLSQILMASVLIILYFFSIILILLVNQIIKLDIAKV